MSNSNLPSPRPHLGLLDGLSQQLEALDTAVVRQAARFRAVMEIGTTLASTQDVDSLLGPVIERLESLLGAEAATLFMLEEVSGELVGRVVRGGALRELRVPSGSGIAGHVARTGESLLLTDAYSDPRFNPDVDRRSGFRSRSMVAVPLRHVSGRILGVVQVLHRGVGIFSLEDQVLVEAIATQIAGVLDNLRLMETLRAQNEQLRRAMLELSVALRDLDLLYELEQAAHSSEAEPQVLERVLTRAIATLGAEFGSILLVGEDRNRLHVRRAVTEGQGRDPHVLSLRHGQGIAGQVAASGQRIRIDEGAAIPAAERTILRKLGLTARAVLSVPILGDDRVMGALTLFNRPAGFDAADERLATLLAGLTGRAVLLRRERLEGERRARLAALGQLMSGVMHDLRSPMTVVSGYAQLMAAEPSESERLRLAATIEQQVEHVAAMTGETLAFARGERELLLRTVYLQPYFREVEALLRSEFEGAGVELELQLQDNGSARFDENKLKRVITNVARNAAEAMPDGGHFTLKVLREKTELVLRMSDTGPGMSPELEAHAFESFVTEGKPGGSGLGLAIVKRIVEAHGGRVAFHNRSQKGPTTVEVRLPS